MSLTVLQIAILFHTDCSINYGEPKLSYLEIYANFGIMYINNFFKRRKNTMAHVFAPRLALCFSFLLLLLSPGCKKKETDPLRYPPKASVFAWNQDVRYSLSALKKGAWSVLREDKNSVYLHVPIKAEELQVQGLQHKKAPEQASLTLFLEKGKLVLARLLRYDKAKLVEEYFQAFQKNYDLKKALWAAQSTERVESKRDSQKKNKREQGALFAKKAALYETKKTFIVVYQHILRESKEESLAKGRTYTLEILLYSKDNPGLSSQKLITRIKQDI